MSAPEKAMFSVDIRLLKLYANVHVCEKMSIYAKLITTVMWTTVFLQTITNIGGLIINWDNFDKKIDNFLMTNVFIVVTIQLITFIWYKPQNEILIRQVYKLKYENQIFFAKENYKQDLLDTILKNIDIICYCLLIAVNITNVAWWIAPFFSGSNDMLPFKNVWLPFKAEEFESYVYVFQICADFFGAGNGFLISSFYFKVAMVIGEQFKILHHSLIYLDFDLEEGPIKNKLIYNRLKKCIDFHCNILK